MRLRARVYTCPGRVCMPNKDTCIKKTEFGAQKSRWYAEAVFCTDGIRRRRYSCVSLLAEKNMRYDYNSTSTSSYLSEAPNYVAVILVIYLSRRVDYSHQI